MAAGEIKSTLTLDASNFSAAIEKAQTGITGLEKGLASATKVTAGFEKSVAKMGEDVGGVGRQFSTLASTLGSLIDRLDAGVGTGLERVSKKARAAKEDIAGLATATEKTGTAFVSMADWTQRYGAVMESIHPKIALLTKSQQELQSATTALGTSSTASAEVQIRAKIKTLETEKTVNAESIQAKRKLIGELALLDGQASREAEVARLKAADATRRLGAYGGKNIIANSGSDAATLEAYSTGMRNQITALTELTNSEQLRNLEIANSITWMGRRADFAAASAIKEKEASLASMQANFDAAAAKKAANALAAKETKDIKIQEEAMWRKVENDQAALASVQARFRRQQAVEEHRAARKAMRDADGLGSDIERDQVRATLEAKRAAAATAKIIAKDASDYAKQQDLQAKNAQKEWNAQQLAERKAGIREIADAERGARNASMEANRAQQAAVRTADRERIQAIREQGALERQQAQQTIDMWKGLSAMWAGAKIESGLVKAVHSADDYARVVERVNGASIGGQAGKDNTFAVSKQVEAQNPNMNKTEALKLTMSAVAGTMSTDKDMLSTIVPEIAKVLTVMTRQFPEQTHNLEDFGRNVMGVMESRGITNSPEKMLSTLDNLSRALILTQGKMDVKDYETIMRRGGPGNAQLKNDEAILYDIAAASQMKVMGGGSGGGGGGVSSFANMQKQAENRATGGTRETERGTSNLVEFGIIDAEKLKAANNGALKGSKFVPVAYEGAREAAENMTKYSMDLVKKVKKKLVSLPESDERFWDSGTDRTLDSNQAQAFGRWSNQTFGNTSVKQYYQQFQSEGSSDRIEAEVKGSQEAPKYDKAWEEGMKSFGLAGAKAHTAFTNLAITVGTQLIPVIQPLLEGFTRIVAVIAELASTHSATTKVVALSVAFAGIVLTIKGLMSVFGMVTGGMDSIFGKIASSFGIMSKSAKASELANIAHLQSQVNMTAASRDFTAMKLKEAQGNVTGLVGMKDVVTAHQTAAKATAEHTAASRLLNQAHVDAGFSMKKLGGGLVSLAGGPIGILIAAITLAAWAWDTFGNNAENAAKKAESAARRAKSALDGVSSTEAVASNKSDIKDKKKQIAGMEYDANAAYQSGDVGNTARDAAARSAIVVAQHELNVLLAEEARHKVNIAKANADAVQVAKDLIRMKDVGAITPEARAASLSNHQRFGGGLGPVKVTSLDDEAASGTNSTKGLFESPKAPKVLESFFIKQFETIEARAKELHLKLQTIITGEPSHEDQAKAAVLGELLAGNLDKGHDASKREFLKDGYRFNPENSRYTKDGGRKGRVTVSGEEATDMDKRGTDGLSLNGMVAAKTDELKAADELKAVTFAKERLAATEATLLAAQERTTNGTGKQTNALNALEREYARLDKARLPGAKDGEQYTEYKTESLLTQAKSDMLTYMSDMKDKTEAMTASLTIDENLQQINSRDRLTAIEDQKVQIIKDAYRTKLNAMIRAGEDEKAFQAQHERQMAIIMRQSAENLMTPLQKLVSGWQDTRKAIEDSQVQWANGFVSVIQNALNGASSGFRQLMVSILKDIQSTMIKNALGGVIQGAAGGIGNAANKLIGATSSGALGGAAGAAGGPGSATNQMWAMFSKGLKDGAKGLDGMISGMTGLNSHMIENIANWIVQLFTGEAKVVGDVTEIEASLALSATTLFAATSIATLGAAAAASAAMMSGGSILSAVASANGNVMTSMGPLALNKYANGGIATSPQLSLFGEGKMNEAYVPLPDGRSIPVTMKGGGGDGAGTSVVIQINVQSDGTSSTSANANNDWSKMADRVRGIVVDEMATQKRPGGILYK